MAFLVALIAGHFSRLSARDVRVGRTEFAAQTAIER